ncbi:Nuclear transport factor 2 [Tieghemiomyces parasiticus]|uniref:Nuclear transport factor 2 n=1 Tax=Tieghemiomyces parasiticus TaxID=78921 RepID=A0A9W8E1F7_9FUNG|nr:Nuclear transport factor 2 [Tieghemiomyces parasiticus]
MADINTVARSFADYYYGIFDKDRSQLAPLYRDASMLTFEGQQFLGAKAVVEKLASLPFQAVRHRVSTVDAQPANPQGSSIIVSVTGQLLVDEESNPQQFSQTFQLISEAGSYWVYNDIFRLNYG